MQETYYLGTDHEELWQPAWGVRTALPDPPATGDSSSSAVASAPSDTAEEDPSILRLAATATNGTSPIDIDSGAVDTSRSGPPTPELEEAGQAASPVVVSVAEAAASQHSPTVAGSAQTMVSSHSEPASSASPPHVHSPIVLTTSTTRSVKTVDSAIALLLVLAVALVCRRLV
ncbi:hypothetical protein HWV62_1528 [Athelia sp. TMB]|nr:hypothetical protein HWV62_23156 [Athelia sp. TMB]KAF7978112.1 hypothetical protein HWV62_1528 [Athelia sp. TMB]